MHHLIFLFICISFITRAHALEPMAYDYDNQDTQFLFFDYEKMPIFMKSNNEILLSARGRVKADTPLKIGEFADAVMNQSFLSQQSELNLRKANAVVASSLGGLFPGIKINLASAGPQAAVLGLLNPLIPGKWVRLAKNESLSEQAFYTKLSVLREQYFSALVFYLNLHRLEFSLAIHQFYLSRLHGFIEYLNDHLIHHPESVDSDGLSNLRSKYYKISEDADKIQFEVAGLKPFLKKMIFDEKKGRSYRISPLKPSSLRLPFENEKAWNLVPVPTAQDIARKISFELKSLYAYKSAMKAGVAESSVSFLSADKGDFILSLGAEMAGQIQEQRINVEIADLMIKETQATLDSEVLIAIGQMEISRKLYENALEGLEINHKNMKEILEKFSSVKTGDILNYDSSFFGKFVKKIELDLQHEVTKSEALHRFWIAHSKLERYIMTQSLSPCESESLYDK